MKSLKPKRPYKLSATILQKMRTTAQQTQKKAYAPYSGFQIGASVLTADGKIFGGANMENASYGATVCAERVAVWKALSEGSSLPLQAIFVISSAPEAWPPCGMCRQVLSEFADENTQVFIQGKKGTVQNFSLSELIPYSFGRKFIHKKSQR